MPGARISNAVLLAAAIMALLLLPATVAAGKKDKYPIQLTEIGGRDGKLLFKATWGWGGRLGTFHDVDADGKREFIALDRDKGEVTLRLIQVDDSGPVFDAPAGKGHGAGLSAVNLDDDEALEFIVAHGDKIGILEIIALSTINGLLAGFAGVPILEVGDYVVIASPVLRANHDIDLYDVVAFDDDGPVERGVWAMPSWHVFGRGADRAYLVFGENRRQLRMISLQQGTMLWSTDVSDKVLEIVPLPDGDRFIVVSADGIQLMNTAGTVLATYPAPEKIKTKFPPVYRDLNGDGELELVFVSGKKFICWQPATNEILWERSMFGLVGGANPVQLYGTFHDIDHDGWLDVPGAKGGGTGHWLSGKTGEKLTEVNNGSAPPIVGDWDGNGRAEIFWFKTWYEVPAQR